MTSSDLNPVTREELLQELDALKASFPVTPNFLYDTKKFSKLCNGQVNTPVIWEQAYANPWNAFLHQGTQGTATLEVVTLDKLADKGIPYGGDLKKAVNYHDDERGFYGGDFNVLLIDAEITGNRDDTGEPGAFFILAQGGGAPLTGWNTGEEITQSRVMVNVVSQSDDIRFDVMRNRSGPITVGASEVGQGWLYHTSTKVGLGGGHHSAFIGLGRMKVAVCLMYESFGDHGKDRFLWAGSVGNYFSNDVLEIQ